MLLGQTDMTRLLRFGLQRNFVSAMFHAHFNAHKPPKTVAPTVLILE